MSLHEKPFYSYFKHLRSLLNIHSCLMLLNPGTFKSFFMKKQLRITFSLVLLFAIAGTPSLMAQFATSNLRLQTPIANTKNIADTLDAPSDKTIPGQYIVVLKDGPSTSPLAGMAYAERQSSMKNLAASTLQRNNLQTKKVLNVFGTALKGFSVSGLSEGDLEKLRKDPSVKYIQQDQIISLDVITSQNDGNNKNTNENLPGAKSGTQNTLAGGKSTLACPILEVNGQAYLSGRATFGADLATLTAELILVSDGTIPDSDACETIQNDLTGKIALIDRGTCEFGSKALKAQNAGAIAVIIVNNVPGSVITMGGGAEGDLVNIQVTSVSLEDGNSIKTELANGTVTATLNKFDTQCTPWGISRVGGGLSGAGKRAWVIDSGVDTLHPDLNLNKEMSRSFVSYATSIQDDNGHGTHVAGTIAAIDNSFGVIGVAAGAEIVSVKVMAGDGGGESSWILAGIDYVAAHAVAGDVANYSIGGPANQVFDDAVLAASALCKFTLSAGNNQINANYKSPARLNGPNIYTISAMDVNDNWAYFSNFGNPPIDYCQPGVDILSCAIGGGYKFLNGTSMAAPHMAGLLLLGDVCAPTTVNNDPDGMPDLIAEHDNGTYDIVYVKHDASGLNTGASWEDAFTDLQSALSITCTSLDQIWVAGGTYYPTAGIDRTIAFVMKNDLAIYGGFDGNEAPGYDLSLRDFTTNQTILSGDIGTIDDISDNSYHVIYNFGNSLDATAILDGFTISDGNANGASPNHLAGGMLNYSSSPAVSNCIFKDNTAETAGALYQQSESPLTISNCSFLDNSAQVFSGAIQSFSDIDIHDCKISGNQAENAGGIFIANGVMTMINTEVSNNTATYQAAAINLQDCPSATLTNCLIAGNISQNSNGAIANLMYSGSSPVLTLINSTVAGNTSQAPYAAIWSSGGNTTTNLKNTIVADNTSANFYASDGSTIAGFASQGNNLDSDGTSGFVNNANGDIVGFDPLFVAADDFHLQPCSPAIDAGNNAGAPDDDLDENPRPFSPMGANPATVDMGCYEYSLITDICTLCQTTAFAGNDSSIFANETYTLAEAMAENYTSVSWTTEGDGVFDSVNKLNPVYTPGTADIAAGGVELCIEAQPLSACLVSGDHCMSLTINLPPEVEIVSPTDGTTLFDYTLTVSGTASDVNGDLAEVYVRLDGGSWQLATGTTSWNFDFTLTAGYHLIEAKAVDLQSLESDLDEITVFVGIQEIELPHGWSLISSFLDPSDPDIVNLWADVVGEDNLKLMIGMDGIYAPAPFNINTLTNWDVLKGYKVKMNATDTLVIEGYALPENEANFDAGANIIPVLTNQPTPLLDVFDTPDNDILYILELTSTQIYWPDGGIYTLTDLIPGKGYLANFNNPVTLTYPDYSPGTKSAYQELPPTEGPWVCARTGNFHLISLTAEAINDLENADFLGAFDSDGNCVGYTPSGKTSGNILLTVYGNDETSLEKDGYLEGELLHFRSFSMADNSDTELRATFSESFASYDGLFTPNGLSAITAFKAGETGIGENMTAASVQVYPNPAMDVLNITLTGFETLSGLEASLISAESRLVRTLDITTFVSKINIRDLQPGVYILKIMHDGEMTYKKVVVR